MSVNPPSGYDYFTLTPSWNASKAVSFWDRFGDGSILAPVKRNYGYGRENLYGNHPRNRRFAGFILNATVRANPDQYQMLLEVIEQQQERADDNLQAYFTLSDRYNWYPLSSHLRYSRSRISGTLDTSRSPNVARLAFPVIITDFSADPVTNLANATGEPDHACTIDLAEIP